MGDKENEKCPKCGEELWGLEYQYPHPEAYDGLSEWFCPPLEKSHYRRGRWTGNILKDGEIEPRYGEKR